MKILKSIRMRTNNKIIKFYINRITEINKELYNLNCELAEIKANYDGTISQSTIDRLDCEIKRSRLLVKREFLLCKLGGLQK